MKITREQRPRRSDIDMVPMINFAFLLLIFFMLAGNFTGSGPLPVQVPRSQALTGADPAAQVLILAADGQIALNQEFLANAQLAERAAQWHAQYPGEPLQIKADAGIAASRVVDILETLRGAGIEHVLLLTTRPAE